ncbi:MAG: hypothetical protein MAG795_00140 [Candidatus Woesearchaeota archaeon]|nr:hypothetical protein [Candidatus Woesearchaeota archaeon]
MASSKLDTHLSRHLSKRRDFLSEPRYQSNLIDMLKAMDKQEEIDMSLLLKKYGPSDTNVFLKLLYEVNKNWGLAAGEIRGDLFEAIRYDPGKDVWKLRIGERRFAAKYIDPENIEKLITVSDIMRQNPWLDAPMTAFSYQKLSRKYVMLTEHAEGMTVADQLQMQPGKRKQIIDSVVENYLTYMFVMDAQDPFDGFEHKDPDYSIEDIANNSKEVYGLNKKRVFDNLNGITSKISDLEEELGEAGIDFCLPYYDIWIYNLVHKKNGNSNGQESFSYSCIDFDNADKKRTCLTSLSHLTDNCIVDMNEKEESEVLENIVGAIAVYQSMEDFDPSKLNPIELGKMMETGKKQVSDGYMKKAHQLFNLTAILKDLKMVTSYLRPDYIDTLIERRNDISRNKSMNKYSEEDIPFWGERYDEINQQINQFYGFIDGYLEKIEWRLSVAENSNVIDLGIVQELGYYVDKIRQEEKSKRIYEKDPINF